MGYDVIVRRWFLAFALAAAVCVMWLFTGCASPDPAARARIRAELLRSAEEFTQEAHGTSPQDRVTWVYRAR